MKKSIRIILSLLLLNFAFAAHAQVFNENFDGGSVNMTSSGVPGFIVTNAYSQSLPNSAHGMFDTSGVSTLTSPDFSTSGSLFVTLHFSHICKSSFFDSCVVELSTNSGLTWTQLNSTTCTYLGSSANFATTKWFAAFSYPVWDINNPGTMSNTWWQQEVFDISTLCANQPSVRFRFRMRDNSANGMENFYGWVIDNIEVNAAPCESLPPTVNVFAGPSGTLFIPVNTLVGAYINDNSGNIASAQLFYSVNNQAFLTVSFNNVSDSTYIGFLPTVNIGDTVCWYVSALDSCGNSNLLTSSCYYVNAPPCDMIGPSLNLISGPQNISTPAADTVKIAINDNTFIIVNPTLQYQVNGGSFISVPLNNPVASLFEGVIPAVNAGDTVCWYIHAADTCANVTVSALYCFIALDPDTLPYADNFETGSLGWVSSNLTFGASQWQLGMPSFGATTGTHSGANAWDVELFQPYLANTNCVLTSPIFDLTGDTNASVSFWQNYNSEPTWDGVRMEYSTDGTLWTVLGFVGDPNATNWYNQVLINSSGLPAWSDNSGGWVKSTYNLSLFDNAPSLQFRFIFTADGAIVRDGHSIDDFSISTPSPVDGGVDVMLAPSSPVPANTGVPVTLQLKNFGSQTLTSMNVSVTVNGGLPQTQTWTGSLLSNQVIQFTPFFNIILQPGNNTVCAWAVPLGDGNPTNDTMCAQVYAIPTVNIPYANNFENNSNDWYAPVPPNLTTQWQLGTPNYSFTTSAHSPDTCWDVNLVTPYFINASAFIQSPYFNITGLNALRFSFWQNQHIEVNDGFWIEYDYDNAGLWAPLGVIGDPNGINWYNSFANGIPAWSLGSTGWQKSEYTKWNISGHSSIAFRILFYSDGGGAGLNTGVSVDDIAVNPVLPLDAGIKTIYSPPFMGAGSTAPPWQVAIRNYGSQSITNIPVTITLSGTPINTFAYSGTILPGDSALVTVSGYTVPSGVYALCAYTSFPGDGEHTNDTLCNLITGVPVIVPIYTDNFDSGNIGWTSVTTGNPSSQWELGPPAFGATSSAYSAPDCWDINLNTPYGTDAECYLYSPYFDFSSAYTPYVSFWQNYSSEFSYDGTRLEYSFNGAPWSVLGYAGDPNGVNWYTAASIFSSSLPAWAGITGSWQESRYDLNSFPPTSLLQFRFVFTSDASVIQDGYSIDNFTLFSAFAQDVGVKAVVTPGPNAGAPLYTPVVLRIKNFGYNPSGNFDVTYIANGGSPVTLPFTGTLQPGDSADIAFTGFTTQPGLNFIKAYTGMGGDLYLPNDTLNFTFWAVFTTTPPYVDNFDTGNIGWSVVPSVTGTTWELGMPNFGTTNSVHTGTACWDVNLDAPYSNAAITRLISPVFNYVNSLSSTLRFWTNYSMEYGQDGMQVEYTTDGVNFNVLGIYNDPNGTNWYDNAAVAAFGGNAAFSGSSLGWREVIYNTTQFSGSSYIQYAFLFRSDVNLSGDGVSVDDFELTNVVGMDEISASMEITLQPNPVLSHLTLTIAAGQVKDGIVNLSITDVTGKQVRREALEMENNFLSTRLDVSQLKAGVYFVNIETGNGMVVRKFVKQ